MAASLCLLGSLGQSDDLAALAKREKARRAKVQNPGKVLTESDAAARTGGSVTEMAGPASPSAPAAPYATSPSEEERVSWKGRADAARQAIVTAEKELVQQERETATFRSDVSPLSADAQDPMRLQKREVKIAEMNKLVEAKKAEVAAARAALTALEDQARRAGVPPGWLR